MAKFFGIAVPFLDLLGVRGERLEDGRSEVALDPRPDLTNHFGQVHGGALFTLLDVAMASAARSLHPDAEGVVTVSLTINFIRAGRGHLTAGGRVRQAGRSLVFCDGDVLDEKGELVATGTGTFKLRPRHAPARPGAPGAGAASPD